MEGIITLTLTLNLGVGVEARPESDRILVIQLVVYFFLTARLYVLFSNVASAYATEFAQQKSNSEYRP